MVTYVQSPLVAKILGNPKVNPGCYFLLLIESRSFCFQTNEAISDFLGLHLVSIVLQCQAF